MAIFNKIINFAKNIDIKKAQQAEELLAIKGSNVISSFKNIWNYTDKKVAEKEILKLEKKVNKKMAKGKKSLQI